MKIEFLRDYKFYLPTDQAHMHVMSCGDVMELDNKSICQKWIDRKIAKAVSDRPEIEIPEVSKYENKMEDIEAKEEKKPATTKRRARKAK